MLRNRIINGMLLEEDGGGGGGGVPPVVEPPVVPDADVAKLQADLAKAQKAINDLTSENAQKKRELKDKMTAEELKDAEIKEKADQLKALTEQVEQGKLSANKVIAETLTLSVAKDADIKDGDPEFTAFVHALTSTDKDNTTKLSTYFAKIVKSAYDKGVADTTKTTVNGTGDGVKTGGGDGTEVNEFKAYQEARKQPQSHIDLNPKK